MEGEYIFFVHEDKTLVGNAFEVRDAILAARGDGYKNADMSAFLYESGEDDINYYWEEGEETDIADFFF